MELAFYKGTGGWEYRHFLDCQGTAQDQYNKKGRRDIIYFFNDGQCRITGEIGHANPVDFFRHFMVHCHHETDHVQKSSKRFVGISGCILGQ